MSNGAIISAWGKGVHASGLHLLENPANQVAAVKAYGAGTDMILPFGCGRSYGDVALNPGGRLIATSGLNRFLSFDTETGILDCEAGVTLCDILIACCRPDRDGSGWFLPVSPGTRFVSVGGAIANDVHGKNHHVAGTFGCHVLSFVLARSDGQVMTCSPTEHPDLFAATIGGLGLTGLILSTRLALRRVEGSALEAQDDRFDKLADFFALAAETERNWEYTAAWIDCLAKGKNAGRGIFSRARHAPGIGAEPPAAQARFSVPMTPPISMIGGIGLHAFNAAYWRKLGLGRVKRQTTGSYEPVFYPLDAIGGWNQLYGPKGFHQFQCAVPAAVAPQAIEEMLGAIAKAGEGSMLAVLKTFGDKRSPGLLSFPMPGATLALDFPARGASTLALLRRLESITRAAGGRIYPAKDSVMSKAAFQEGYPNHADFVKHIDPAASSGYARRVGLLPTQSQNGMTRMHTDASTRVAIFGATSGMAVECARLYAGRKARLILVGRDAAALEVLSGDLKVLGAGDIKTLIANLSEVAGARDASEAALAAYGGLDIVLVAHGSLSDQSRAQAEVDYAADQVALNLISPMVICETIAPTFEAQKAGSIAVITSVAGDRGRQSNYVYGAAKGGLQKYLEGLRHRLAPAKIGVTDIRPGFVRTAMTAHLDRRGALWANPDRVAREILRAVDGGKAVLYTPFVWSIILGIICALPRPIFHKSKL
jgi:short-subunit dehydrogenase/FAD/FMN-containing dehydrogenase